MSYELTQALGSVSRARAITPHNDEDLATQFEDGSLRITRGIYVGTSGDLSVKMADGTDLIWPSLAAGMIHPIRVLQVYAADTGAEDIIGIF